MNGTIRARRRSGFYYFIASSIVREREREKEGKRGAEGVEGIERKKKKKAWGK